MNFSLIIIIITLRNEKILILHDVTITNEYKAPRSPYR